MTVVSGHAMWCLTQARTVVEPALRAAIARLDPTTATQASYHFGWTDAQGSPAAGGGKAVRPALALLSARAVGGSTAVAVPGAVAVELVHNFSLLHDDLMDGDSERRHRTTVWALWGPPSAILTGDALLGLALEVLLEVPGPHAASAARLVATTTRDLIRGQVEDMSYEGNPAVAVEAVLGMAAAKTGALLSASAAIGAVLSGAPRESVDALAEFGAELGLAFQLVDDVLGIWGDPARTGKPRHSDLRSRKTSLPVAWVIEQGGRAGAAVAEWLAAESADTDERLRGIADLLAQAGGADWARAQAARRAAHARQCLDRLDPSDAVEELRELAEFVVGRDR